MCAYNPGVQDRRGEILAQGITAGVNSAAQGWQMYQQNKLRNQAIQGENEALLKIFSSDPEMQKYAPEGMDKFMEKSMKGGGLSLKDNVQLNGLLNTTIKTRGLIQDQQAQRQQQEMAKQAMQMREIEMQAAKRKQAIEAAGQARLESLVASQKLAQTEGVLTPAAKAKHEEAVSSDAARFVLEGHKVGANFTPEQLSQFMITSQKPLFSEYRKDDPKTGKTYMVRENLRTGEKDWGSIHQPPAPPEVPDPLVREIYTSLARERDEKVAPALASLKAYKEINKILESEDGQIISGAFAKPEIFLKKTANAFGANYKDVENTQKLQGLLAVPLASVIKNFGAGTGLSDADREYALSAVGADFKMDANAVKELIRIGNIAAKNVPKAYRSRLDKAFRKDSTNQGHLMARSALEIEDDADEPAAAAPAKLEIKSVKRIN